MALRDQLRRLKRQASEDAVVIRQRDGSSRAFDRMEVMGELYLRRLAAALGQEPQSSEFVEALANATPESRAAVLALDEGHYEDLDENDPSEVRERILREHSGTVMDDLEPAEEASGPPPDLSE